MIPQLTAGTSHRVDAWLIRSIAVRMLGVNRRCGRADQCSYRCKMTSMSDSGDLCLPRKTRNITVTFLNYNQYHKDSLQGQNSSSIQDIYYDAHGKLQTNRVAHISNEAGTARKCGVGLDWQGSPTTICASACARHMSIAIVTTTYCIYTKPRR